MVICDRFFDASMAYQGYGRGIPVEFIEKVTDLVCNGYRPETTILLDIDPAIGLARARARNHQRADDEGRFEMENVEFYTRIRNGYLELARREPQRIKVIEANRSLKKGPCGCFASARREGVMSFDSFIGNAPVESRLRTKLRENRFPHAVIFAGPQGVGKHTLALMITKALNCPVKGPADFCDECPQCRKINSGVHPDVLTVTLEEDATQIKIEQIRRVLSMLELQPFEGRNKVFIIDPANLLNAQSSNALLKGLEEPPENSFFVLDCGEPP